VLWWTVAHAIMPSASPRASDANPVVGAAMVILFIGHDIFSQLQVISRHYG
jgi:hypothetical protein